METLNRTAVIVRRLAPYAEWANSFDDDGPRFDPADRTSNLYLIHEVRDPRNIKQALRQWWREIFEEELAAWMRYPEDWHAPLTQTMFLKWFEVEVVEMVSDLGTLPIWDS